jgi:hypothetical protein
MKTLNRKYTSLFFVNPEDYKIFVQKWKEYVNSPEGKTLTSADFLYSSILRGKNYKKAFYPGRAMQDYSYPEGLYKARYSFGHSINTIGQGLLQKDWLNKIKNIIPSYCDENTYDSDAYIDESVKKLLVQVEQKGLYEKQQTMAGVI